MSETNELKRFRVVGAVHASKYLGEFEARTAEEAVEMALESERAYVSLCHQCNGQAEDAEVVSAEAEEIDADE